MSNYYTEMTATETIHATKNDFEEISKIPGFDKTNNTTLKHDTSCISVEFVEKEQQIYLYAEESFDSNEIPDLFIKLIGEILKKQGKKHLECGISFHGDKPCPNSHGGTAIRFLANGTIINPITTWPQ